MIEHKRPSWDEYFMDVARAVAKRWTCDRGRAWCVIAKNKQILVTGYVWSLPWFAHCDEVGHLMKKRVHEDGHISQHCERTIHAEQNAICQAAKNGIALDWATLYCNMTPCPRCAMLLVSSGIKRVVCAKKYHNGAESEKMFDEAGILLDFFSNDVEVYDGQ